VDKPQRPARYSSLEDDWRYANAKEPYVAQLEAYIEYLEEKCEIKPPNHQEVKSEK